MSIRFGGYPRQHGDARSPLTAIGSLADASSLTCRSSQVHFAGQERWGRGESNPYWLEPKSTTAPRMVGGVGWLPSRRQFGRPERHCRAAVRTQFRTPKSDQRLHLVGIIAVALRSSMAPWCWLARRTGRSFGVTSTVLAALRSLGIADLLLAYGGVGD